ncbi:MAG: transcriptional repressor LexA [Bryobacteraceae bacterium]|jgi:repressor LexA
MALTPKQKRLLDFIADFVDREGYAPSYAEMKDALQLASLATIHKHIEALEQRKYVRRSFNHSRSIDVAPAYLEERRRERGKTGDFLPLLGRIAAGSPVEAIAGQDTIAFADFTGKGDTFALQVRGESMIDDHICDGDYVLVERTPDAHNGDIVVALVGGVEATLKRFYRESAERVRLQPSNASMEPIYVHPSQLQIQGRVISVLRKYR